MAKKVCWISIPLATASEANDAAVVSFLKGGLKKELEAETATFITKWMSDKSIPFRIDVERSSPDRNHVVAPLPQVSQNAADCVTVPVVAETDKVGEMAEHNADNAVEQIAEVAAVVEEPAGEQAVAVNDEPASQLNEPGGVGMGRARGKAKRRVPDASKAEE